MAENNTPDVRLDTNSNGLVYFASDVVATIAGLAVTEVEGVANTVNGSGSFADIFARRAQSNSKNLTRGIKVEVNGTNVTVDVTIIVEYGSPVPEVATGIQENVKKAIETMTGMSVKSVDVHVAGVSFERENRAAAELEMTQRKLLEKTPAAPCVAAAPEEASEKTADSVKTVEAVKAEEPLKAEPAPSQAEEEPEDDGEFVLELEDVDMEEIELEEKEKAEAKNAEPMTE